MCGCEHDMCICTHSGECLFMLACTFSFRRAHGLWPVDGWRLRCCQVRVPPKFLLSPLSLWSGLSFTVSFSEEPTTERSHTSSYLPLMIVSSLILLQLSFNSSQFFLWCECTWLSLHVCARIQNAEFSVLFPGVLPNGLHKFCKQLQDWLNWTFMHEKWAFLNSAFLIC